MKKIMLYPNPTRDIGLIRTAEVAKVLRHYGLEVTMPTDKAEEAEAGGDALCDISVMPFENAVKNADMIISLGGDGSILHTAKQAAVHNIPVLGINVGRVGYMAELEVDELYRLGDVIRGDYTTEDRMMLDVEVLRGDSVIHRDTGLNDIVLVKRNFANTVDLDMYTDRFFISHYQGDGVIVATPTGSTAYSMSAGGPIVDPLAENVIITPVCTHSLSAKPIVLSPKRRITVQVMSCQVGTVGLSVDGAQPQPLEYGDQVVISVSQMTTQLIKVSNKNFYDILCSKLSDRRFGDR